MAQLGDAAELESPTYASFGAAIEAVFALAKSQRYVFVIDEYPYLARADASVSSVLQHAIDNHKDSSQLMLILCGSSMSFMFEQVLGYESPLYGRRTAQLKVEPFDFAQTRAFYPSLSPAKSLEVYALTGGIPLYLEKVDPSLSIEKNLAHNFLDPSCYLFEEPGNLLKQELREPRQYNNVLQSIANGASKLNEIATASQMPTSNCTFLLDNLQELGIVSKELPFGESSRRKGIYRISDTFFRFWFRYVPRYMALSQTGKQDIAAGLVAKRLPEFVGPVFEDVCLQWLWMRNGNDLPVLMLEAGRWWGSNPKTKQQEEIDIVATGEPKGAGLACECKWTKEKVGASALDKLAERADLLPIEKPTLFVFSRSGFTDECHAAADTQPEVRLIEFDEMGW
ncbi:MAG: restriction endonuclease [Atopobiaceae bacterium]|nr:restriction endonuclease [Atopobiaceae bacterium]